MRKRKTTYPVARTSRQPAPPGAGTEPAHVRAGVTSIDLNASAGRPGIQIGARVRIIGTGLYSGETAVVESVPGGVISAAMVRTADGKTRRVRTIDLEPLDEQ